MKREQGFTIVEVIVAIVVLTVGVLGLVTTAALVTRMIARGQRSAVAAIFAAQRLERLRRSACTVRTAGSDTLYRGAGRLAVNSWTFIDAGNSTYRVRLVTTYLTAQNRTRSDTMETAISCIF